MHNTNTNTKYIYYMTSKIKYVLGTVLSFVGLTGIALADTAYSTSTIPTAFGSVLSGIVNDIISTVISFLTTNLPVIIILSVSISIVFWLIAKARRAGHGR